MNLLKHYLYRPACFFLFLFLFLIFSVSASPGQAESQSLNSQYNDILKLVDTLQYEIVAVLVNVDKLKIGFFKSWVLF